MKKTSKLVLWLSLILSGCYFNDEPLEDSSPWSYAQPSQVNMDQQILRALDFEVTQSSFGRIRAVAAIKDGSLIFENYYAGLNRNTEHFLTNATFSVMSVLVGVAIQQGFLQDLDTPINTYFPDYAEFFDTNPLKQQITIRHLLQMRSGISWFELGLPSVTGGTLLGLTDTNDWIEFVLAQEMDATPGQRYSYNSGHGILLADILGKAAGMSFQNFADEFLFQPLGISSWRWDGDAFGNTNGGFGLYLNLLDFTKIGYLYLQEGAWEGRQMVSADWVASSTSANFSLDGLSNVGLGWQTFTDSNSYSQLFPVNDTFFAEGTGGQFMFIVPHQRLVIAITSDNYFENGFSPLIIFRDYFGISIR